MEIKCDLMERDIWLTVAGDGDGRVVKAKKAKKNGRQKKRYV